MDRFLYRVTSMFQSERAVYHKLVIKNFYNIRRTLFKWQLDFRKQRENRCGLKFY